MDPNIFTREKAIVGLWEIAAKPPEDTRGTLTAQIRACKMMYDTLGYEPALGRLSELASIDPTRTKGHGRGQESAAKLLKRFLNAVKVDKSGIQ